MTSGERIEILFIQHNDSNKMTSPKFVVYLTCMLSVRIAQTTEEKGTSSFHQESGFISANVGDSVTLRCFYEGEVVAKYYWYIQILGQKPRLISTFYVYDTKGIFYDEFKDNPRFTLVTGKGQNHLTITELRISDSAAYYCGHSHSVTFEFAEGKTVSVKGSGLNVPALVHQSASETIQPGGSVTLNCTVDTGTCDGEHSVYWFKNSEESHPGLIYTHGDRNDQCERKPDTQIQTCVYNLPTKGLNFPHAGTYYCAVASCGHILFGNGTKLDIEDEVPSLALMYFLSGALAFTTILVVLLTFSVYKMSKRNNHQRTVSRARSAPSTGNSQDYENSDHLYYAALSVNLRKRSRRQNQTWSACVYYNVKL